MQHAMNCEIEANKETNDCPKIGEVENYKMKTK